MNFVSFLFFLNYARVDVSTVHDQPYTHAVVLFKCLEFWRRTGLSYLWRNEIYVKTLPLGRPGLCKFTMLLVLMDKQVSTSKIGGSSLVQFFCCSIVHRYVMRMDIPSVSFLYWLCIYEYLIWDCTMNYR